MSLREVLNEKTKKARYDLLSAYLRNRNVGDLNETETVFYKHIFSQFYTPDEKETKFETSRISSVFIVKDNYGKKCFSICVDEKWHPTSIKRLSGSKRNEKYNMIRALRKGIEDQIIRYRRENPFNPNDICPITQNLLGADAQVDHVVPFHKLAEEWLKSNTNPSYKYDLKEFDYVLNQPYLDNWSLFHLKQAVLRWTSKEGNKIAHKV